MKLKVIGFEACLAWLILSGATGLCWGPAAHVLTAQFPGGAGEFMNLPDAVTAELWIWHNNEQGVAAITPDFAWSHACQANGSDGVPEKPVYNDAIADPGTTMYTLVTQKLDPRWHTEDDLKVMKQTARGFACHNAADRKVHFDYFEGGPALLPLASWSKWLQQHYYKERWAEYVLIKAKLGWSGVGDLPNLNVTVGGHAGIINLAQKVFRKNGRTVDLRPTGSGDQLRPGPVVAASDIATLLSNQSAGNTALYSSYSQAKFEELESADYAATWQDTQILGTESQAGLFDQAKAAVMDAFMAMPSANP